jgi:hypothetical protein
VKSEPDDNQQELARLRAENEALKAAALTRPLGISLKVGAKGGVSLYGLQRYPITLYRNQWEKLLDHADTIRQFLDDNAADLKVKA